MLRCLFGTSTTIALAALAACATLPPAPQMGAQPDPVAPRLVKTDKTDPATGRALLDWDRPTAFGGVEGERKALGDAACMGARVDLEALGYHPAAQDENGLPLPGGGYYCYPKRNGAQPDAVPPALVYAPQPGPDGRRDAAWDRPAAFGQVPSKLQAKGDAACMRADVSLEAIAYHPRAIGIDGQPLPGGGFFCYRKKMGEQPADAAPKLVQVDGITGWDRPAAFGAVPPALQARGDSICKNGGNAALRAIGYHPQALDEQSRPIGGGGFFCAARGTAKT